MTELLRRARTLNAEYCAQGGHAQFWPKILNLPNKVKTKQMGALPVATDVLSTRISFFEIGQKMAELWATTLCPNMGATA